MTVKLVKEPEITSYRDSEDYLKRQQNIDAILVLAKVLELPIEKDIQRKAENKILGLLDKI